jgi:ABC-type transport system involved in cytochrome c biogenesis permease subunit
MIAITPGVPLMTALEEAVLKYAVEWLKVHPAGHFIVSGGAVPVCRSAAYVAYIFFKGYRFCCRLILLGLPLTLRTVFEGVPLLLPPVIGRAAAYVAYCFLKVFRCCCRLLLLGLPLTLRTVFEGLPLLLPPVIGRAAAIVAY